MKDPVLIETPKGVGGLDKIYLSELGFLMLKVYFENGTFITYNLGKHNPSENMFTDKIMEYEKYEDKNFN
jgi:hypothetical protein